MPRKNEAFDIEIVLGMLSRSSLPTVVVEGEDDIVVYRRMEELFSEVNLSVLPVGGRNNVLSIFERLNEIHGKKRIAFIADLDTWVLSNVPPQYISDCLVFTDGYSIENDIFKDGELKKILHREELIKFESDIANFAKWYALAISRINAGHNSTILKSFPDNLLDKPEIFRSMTTLDEQEIYPQEIHTWKVLDANSRTTAFP